MMKLIAAVTGEPLSHLLEMPEHYCQSCGMILTPDDCGTDAHGAATDHYRKWCYDHGKYAYETTMEAMIEDCAPRAWHKTLACRSDEAVSLMGAVLPQLERWRTVQENEERYGAEARARYGDEVIDAANEALLDMDPQTWNDMKELERAILGQLDCHGRRGSQEHRGPKTCCDASSLDWSQLGTRTPRRSIPGPRPRLSCRSALYRLLRQALRHRSHGVSGTGHRVVVDARIDRGGFGYFNRNLNRLETPWLLIMNSCSTL